MDTDLSDTQRAEILADFIKWAGRHPRDCDDEQIEAYYAPDGTLDEDVVREFIEECRNSHE